MISENIYILVLIAIIPSMLIVLIVYLMLKQFFDQNQLNKETEIRKKNTNKILPQRLQAYERMALFLERIKPIALVRRVDCNNKTADDYEYELIKAIQNEWDHNLSMQIYVNPETWRLIYSAKNAIINTIRQSNQQFQATSSSASELQTYIIQNAIQENYTIDSTLLQLQIDVQGKSLS